jgi:hypothetical protein
MLHSSVKVLSFAFGLFNFFGGLIAISAGGEAVVSGVMAVAFGAAIMVAILFQRERYRANDTAGSKSAPGPGAGESGFTDPTTRHVMRVYVDPRTGERRYRAEGRF